MGGSVMTWHLQKLPKIVHFYWGGKSLSFLRYCSVASFIQLNPDWQIKVHRPVKVNIQRPWGTQEQKIPYNGPDFMPWLEALPVEFCDVDLDTPQFEPAHNDLHEVHKSDFYRWHLLATVGGFWSDIDILFCRPMTDWWLNISERSEVNHVFGFNLQPFYHSIGFLASQPNSSAFRAIFEEAQLRIESAKKVPRTYQQLGSHLLGKVLGPCNASVMHNKFGADFRAANLRKADVYAYDFRSFRALFTEHPKEIYSDENIKNHTLRALGFHWYAGHLATAQWENSVFPELVTDKARKGRSLIVELIHRMKLHQDPRNATTSDENLAI